jgi:hypothetical protein
MGIRLRAKPSTKSSKDSGVAAGRMTNLLSPASTNDEIRPRAPAQPSATSAAGSASGRRRLTEAASASGMPPNATARLIPK